MKHTFEVNKILIPIDFSDTSMLALEHAAHMCQKFRSSLHLLHVYKSSSNDQLPNINRRDMDDQDIKRAVGEELQRHGDKFSDKYGVNVDVEVREGKISEEITKAAREANCDMVVMGTHGSSGFEEFFIGSNAYRTVTACEKPVLTVQSHAKTPGFNRIIVPIDSTQHTRDKISEVVTIAKAYDAEVHLVAMITEEHEKEKAIYNLKVKQIEEHFDHKGVNYVRKILHGDDVAKMTMRYAQENDGNLIVIMTDQEESTGLFVGSSSQRIVNHSKISVMSVTPLGIVKGFEQDDLEGDYRPFHV
jgi:nucleotide-binding universal stress UspA family protein